MNLILDDGFQFGLGFFETICLKNGQPILLDWHLERINRSLQAFHIPQIVTRNEVFHFLLENAYGSPSENQTVTEPDSSFPRFKMQNRLSLQIPALHALKIMVSDSNKLFAFRSNPYTPEKLAAGFQLDYSPVMRNETSPLVFHKSMNYGDNILEKRRTKELGIDELVFSNSKGELCEGSTTNLFFVKDGQLCTPPVSCGMLPGVMRRFVMEHFPVQEHILTKEDISDMEECFVTNSLMGIMPVTRLGEKEFTNRTITVHCQNSYADTILNRL